MGKGINHFIWGYQPHFRSGVKSQAKDIFQELDSRFEPEVFVVGILIDGAESYPACVEPEEGIWCQSEDLYDLRKLIKAKIETLPEYGIFHSHPIAQKNADERLIKEAVQLLIKERVEEHKLKPESNDYFVSYPVVVNNYYVSVILGLEEHIISSYPSLSSSIWRLNEFRSYDVSSGLIDSVISSFLGHCSRTLQLPDAGAGNLEISKDEVFRDAAKRLIRDATFRVDSSCITGFHSIFDICNKISCTGYEKSVGRGSIILASNTQPGIKPIIKFSAHPQLNLIKNTRKLLELTADEVFLHSNSEEVFHLAIWNPKTDVNENVFIINFIGHHHWELTYRDQCLMRVLYGLPYLPKPSFAPEKIAEDLPRIFKNISKSSINRVLKLTQASHKF